MSDTIILHMSDLHFSSNEEKKREKDVIMNSLVDALKDLEEEWKPNIIFQVWNKFNEEKRLQTKF